jgi:hypothetical protein
MLGAVGRKAQQQVFGREDRDSGRMETDETAAIPDPLKWGIEFQIARGLKMILHFDEDPPVRRQLLSTVNDNYFCGRRQLQTG